MNNSIVVFDCEIINVLEANPERRLPHYSYCNGWDDHKNMGIAIICAFDYLNDDYLVFTPHKDKNSHYALEVFKALVMNRDYCAGFNNINFDNKLLEANGIVLQPKIAHYDILAEIWKAQGLDPKAYESATHSGYSLGYMAQTNLNQRKSGTGGNAPMMYQDGHIGSVISYCLRDVRLTKELLDIIIDDGQLLSPKDNTVIKINCPFGRTGAGHAEKQQPLSSQPGPS